MAIMGGVTRFMSKRVDLVDVWMNWDDCPTSYPGLKYIYKRNDLLISLYLIFFFSCFETYYHKGLVLYCFWDLYISNFEYSLVYIAVFSG